MFKKLKKYYRQKKSAWMYRNRKVFRAKFLYYYLIVGGIVSFVYAISCIFTKLPFWWAFIPLLLLIASFALRMIKRNWKLAWVFFTNVKRGKLLIRLNEYTHFHHSHKMKLIKWVYPGRKYTRLERWRTINDTLIKNKLELSNSERREMRRKIIICPQQVLDGINKALLVDSLIYAHNYIHFLDDELREIMELSDDNMMLFSLQAEVNKCKKKDLSDEYEKYMELGKKLTKNKQ